MHVEPHHTADELTELIRTGRRAKVTRRLSAVRWALLGHTAPDVAERVLLSERPVQRRRDRRAGRPTRARAQEAPDRRPGATAPGAVAGRPN